MNEQNNVKPDHHRSAITSLLNEIPRSWNNHYEIKRRFLCKDSFYCPDIIVTKKMRGGNIIKECHEVEVVSDLDKKKKIAFLSGVRKVLWLVVPTFNLFDQINIIGFDSEGSLSILKENHLLLEYEKDKLLEEIGNLHLEVEKLQMEKAELQTVSCNFEWNNHLQKQVSLELSRLDQGGVLSCRL